jgi:hypothetical protein
MIWFKLVFVQVYSLSFCITNELQYFKKIRNPKFGKIRILKVEILFPSSYELLNYEVN